MKKKARKSPTVRLAKPAARVPAPLRVVGIGASAGGLEAFRELLRHLPPTTGMAFVLVQHLSPDHISNLAPLLARTSLLPIVEAADGQQLEPDRVYVIPPAVSPTLQEGKLRLVPRPKRGGRPQGIDQFLGSLARELGSRAVGVVLSGTGTDGTRGLTEIQAAGGITLAQAPDSARFPGMSESASAEGSVGRVLPLKELARALALLGAPEDFALPGAAGELDFSGEPEAMARIFQILKSVSGVDFAQYKPTTIHRRLSRRMLLSGMNRLSDYISRIEEQPSELDALRQDLLIHVTSFFRDPETFVALQRDVIPELLRGRPPTAPLRVWVAGCSTGEEAYSIAICFLEALAAEPSPPGLQVFATDLSEAAIKSARAGRYPESIAERVSPERLQRYFVKVAGGYQISKQVRGLCIFARQDMVSHPPFSRMDLISCRNVLIYLGPALQQRVLATLHYALNPHGFLMLGTSETVGAAADLFSLQDKRNKIYRKKGGSLRSGALRPLSSAPGARLPGEPAPVPLSAQLAPLSQREADRIVLAQYAPPGVIINDALEILSLRGQTGPYLEPLPGVASLELLKVVREDLSLELRTAVMQAKRQGSRVRREHVRLSDGPRERRVNIDVHPLRASPGSLERSFLILFEEVPVPPPAPPAARGRRGTAASSPELERTRADLADTREHLQSVLDGQELAHEELRIASEEAQSTNEELQSTNEELETARAELQSTNEELTTLNEELGNRNAELSLLNSDLNNLLGSTHIAALMLGSDLRIRRFTPMAETLLKLSPADKGRLLAEVHSPLLPADLGSAVQAVTETLTPLEREVQDGEGHWFQLRLRPYKTLDQRIDGAVITVLDIDRLKRGGDEARRAHALTQAILDTLREPFLLLDASLRVLSASPAFYKAFQVTRAQTEGRRVYELGNGQWDIPRLRELLEEILPRDSEMRDFFVEHTFEHVGPRRMLLNARRLANGHEHTECILLSIEDVGARI
ncbi:MAG TPA: chemotaxis protein CheB [Myxococcus sp.]|nr:chemotaxis protein CheB [Myxococcus sp.]